MTALLAPAATRLPLTTVEEDFDDDCTITHYTSSSPQHHYVHSLIFGAGNWGIGKGLVVAETKQKQNVFGVSLAETIAAPAVCWNSGSGGGYRSLAEPFQETQTKEMAAAEAGVMIVDERAMQAQMTAPSSPPELSYSKSSKSSSSSLRSDSLDDNDTSTEKLAHFEDISIEDVRDSIEDSNLRPESRPTLKRPPPRSSGEAGKKLASPLLGAQGENRYPTLRGAVNGVLRDQSLNLPHGRGMRRGFTSPTSPSFMMPGSQRLASRSPSPTKPFMQNGVSVTPQTLAGATPSSPNPNGLGHEFARRKSWQPGQQRKTVKELEAEYDDNDEEVPDEAVLENVPISPMPGQARFSYSSSRSATPSPQRRPSAASHANLHSANVPKNAKRPSLPAVLPNGKFAKPKSPKHGRPPMLHHSATISAFPAEPLNRKQRSKSWTEDLNEEARQLSAALEEYEDRVSMEKHGPGSGTNSVSSSPPRPSFSKQRAKTTILELPPVQKGNIMIDPLPISKEKEAMLSRTRPSWLPPKDKREEKRHLKEWEQMMARAAENEKKRALKEQEAHESKEELKGSIARIWDQHVLPNWDAVINEPRTRELWWRGVTPKSRGVVWSKAIGNELELSEASFDAALLRANEFEESIAEMPSEDRAQSNEAAWFDAISRDVPSACPELTAAEKRAPFQNALRDVLKAYAMYRSDVGYVYGTHLIAGVLCLHMRPADAFVTLANMLNRPLPLAFLVHDTAAMSRAYELVLSTLKYKFTKLHDHLTSPATNLNPSDYLDPMFRCLFAYHLPTEHVSRIWDIFALEGDKTLIRAAVAVLGKLEGKLYGSREEIMDLISWRNEKLWDIGGEEEFIMAVREAGKVDSKGARSQERLATPEPMGRS